MRSVWLPRPRSVAGVSVAQCAALVLPFMFVAASDASRYAVLLVAALIAALAFEGAFAFLRGHGPSLDGVTTALVAAIVVPPEIALWQVITVVSLGAVLGELVFGGRGFGFVSPATVALALLVISFPELELSQPTRELALAVLPGGISLLALGLISGRVLLAVGLSAWACMYLSGQGTEPGQIAAALAFGLVFLIADPTSAASTNAGRWIYGALAGGLVALFSSQGVITSEAVIFAALMAAIFAPLIDHLVVLAHVWCRGRRSYV